MFNEFLLPGSHELVSLVGLTRTANTTSVCDLSASYMFCSFSPICGIDIASLMRREPGRGRLLPMILDCIKGLMQICISRRHRYIRGKVARRLLVTVECSEIAALRI